MPQIAQMETNTRNDFIGRSSDNVQIHGTIFPRQFVVVRALSDIGIGNSEFFIAHQSIERHRLALLVRGGGCVDLTKWQ